MSNQNKKYLNMSFVEEVKELHEKECDEIQNHLDKGANVNATDSYGKTALHISIEKQNKECIRILLENDADVHIMDNEGNTPLHLAVMQRSRSIMRMLLDKGAIDDMYDENNNGQSPHSLAEMYGRPFVALLEKYETKEKFTELTPEEKEKRNKNEANMVARQAIAMRQVAEEQEKERQKQLVKNRMEAEYRSERSHPPYSPGFQTLSEQQAAIAKGKWEAEHGGRRRVRKTHKAKKSNKKSKKTRKH